MRVYLAEKKQQGEVITKFLDRTVPIDRHDKKSSYSLTTEDAVVTWCEGHLYELAQPDHYDGNLKEWKLASIPFRPSDWELLPKERSMRQIKEIKACLSLADEVVLCSDYDREGQYLGINAIQCAGFRGRILRAKITSLGQVELGRALGAIEDISLTMPLYYSAMARSHGDWLVGLNLTRFYTCLCRSAGGSENVNIGRVLTPTINLVVQRDNEINNFKTRDYYEMEVTLCAQKGTFKVKWKPDKSLLNDGLITDAQIVQSVKDKVKGQTFTITALENKTVTEQPPLPFSLSELQLYCGNHFGMSPSTTLSIVQKLYDNQYTSYPRTDCQYIPESQHADAPLILQQLKNVENLSSLVSGCDTSIVSHAFNDARMGSSSHNAIIPTTESVNVSLLSPDELKVYDAICRRYIALFYIPAKFDTVNITAKCRDEYFTTTGRTLKVAGYRIIFTAKMLDEEENEQNTLIPELMIGESTMPKNPEILSKKTRAPKRYKQATLIYAMKHIDTLVEDSDLKEILKKTQGIGTEATRAGILKNMLDYGWVEEKGGYLYATPKAHGIMPIIPKEIKSAVMTAKWEHELDRIVSGGQSAENFEDSIYRWLESIVISCRTEKALTFIAEHFKAQLKTKQLVKTETRCPLCDSELIYRKSRNGAFWGCSNENCKFTADDYLCKPVIERCDKCGGLLKRFGYKNSKDHFFKCQNESCQTFYPDINGQPLKKEPVCPDCGRPMRFSGNFDKNGRAQKPYFYCTGYKDKSCFCRVDQLHRKIVSGKKGESK